MSCRHRTQPKGEEVKRLIDEFEASGLSSTAFCRSRGLAPSTLQRHLRVRRLGSESRSPGCRLVCERRPEVKPKAGETQLEVLLSGGVLFFDRILYPYHPCFKQTFEMFWIRWKSTRFCSKHRDRSNIELISILCYTFI